MVWPTESKGPLTPSEKNKGFTLEEIVHGLGQSDVRSKDKVKRCAQWLSSEGKLCLRKD
jgi:hypothetical protein